MTAGLWLWLIALVALAGALAAFAVFLKRAACDAFGDALNGAAKEMR